MKTNAIILILLAVLLASCSQGDEAPSTDEFDPSICVENPEAEGCADVKIPVNCEENPWDPACIGGGGGGGGGGDGGGSTGKTKTQPTAIIDGTSHYNAAPGVFFVMPLTVRADTGKGPFSWKLEGEAMGATMVADGRNAEIRWTPPSDFSGSFQFKAVVTDGGNTSLQSIKIVNVSIPDPLKLSASIYGGPLHGTPVALNRADDGNYSVGLFGMRDESNLMLSVNKLTDGYKVTTSKPNDLKVGETACSGQLCSTIISPMKEASSELQDVAFTVMNRETGDMTRLTINRLLLPEKTSVDNAWLLHSKNLNVSLEDGAGEGNKDPKKSTIAKASIYIRGSDDGGLNAWETPFYMHVHQVKFCKDRNFKKCTKWIKVTTDESDGMESKAEPGNLDKELKGKSLEYLNYFKIFSNGERSDGSYTVWKNDECGGTWESKINSVKVQYKTDADSKNTPPRTHYWNPCVNEWHQVAYYDCKDKCKNISFNETRFSKNDTAICVVTYTVNHKYDNYTFGSLVLPGIEWEDIISQTKYYDVYKKGTMLGRREDMLSDKIRYTAPHFYRSQKREANKVALWLRWGNLYKEYYPVSLFGKQYVKHKFWRLKPSLHGGQVESFGDHIYDCNPYGSTPCAAQQEKFDRDGTRADFAKSITAYIAPPDFDEWYHWEVGWYAAFVFQPGYVMKRDPNTGEEYIDANQIYYARDDVYQWIDEANPKTETVTLKARSGLTKHWTENFSRLGSCFYKEDFAKGDNDCRYLAPKEN